MACLTIFKYIIVDTRDHGSAAILTNSQSSGKQNHVIRVLPSFQCKMSRKTLTPMQIKCYEKSKQLYDLTHGYSITKIDVDCSEVLVLF